eukprot:SAG11_NODE_92_length_17132_cov_10.277285_10_plen_93_part_00
MLLRSTYCAWRDVAGSQVLHQLFIINPELRGDMSEVERQELRRHWFLKLARKPAQVRSHVLLIALYSTILTTTMTGQRFPKLVGTTLSTALR